MGSTVGLGVGINDIVFTGDGLQPHLAATAQLWMDLFLAPGLQPADFNGTVRARVNALAVAPSQTPAAIATRVSSRLHWGVQHPYNRLVTSASLEAITLAECRDFFAAVVRPMGAKLYVAGAVNRAELTAAFTRLLAIPGTGTMPSALPPAVREPGTVFFVHSPAAPQSIITLRGAGPARTAPDYFAGELMAGILAGDSITSRIGLNVREMRGYAYSFSGGFSYSPAGGSFFFSAPVRADATAESVFELLEEIRKMREAGVTPEELEGERRAQSPDQ